MLLRSYVPAHPYWRFLLTGAGLALLWWVGYEHLLGPDGRLDHALSRHVAGAAAGALRAAGFAGATAPHDPTLVTLAGDPAVLVGDPCNGLALYALFAGFVVAYPGSLRRKAWFIPLGVAAVYLLNVARVAALALNHAYWYHTVDFNHHYTFTFVAYAAILGLWRWWAHLGTDIGRPSYEPGYVA
ncbi:exosortase X [Hymenobacter caeli]|uniref:Exosortase/archaeosortase family protein n=1 Tax=Hymenobacter caeli TaxID=2735894 RepID=A0ABX2FQE2_9BACT|nr:exosortase/archaeosortase family protein [Hymenobacter caeli]NRT19388.1 exosortase/archaeosortase family protein [Hymenobacter caeli]